MTRFIEWTDPAPQTGHPRRAFVMPEIRASANDPDGTHEFIITTAGLKRDNNIVRLEGLRVDNYLRNPVVMYAHDYWTLPIGRTVRLTTGEHEWRAEVTYAPTPEAQTVRNLVAEGFLRAASIAWMPIRTEALKDADGNFLGWDYIESDLVEWSIVPVPADPSAVRPFSVARMLQDAQAHGIDTAPLEQALSQGASRGASPHDGRRRELLEQAVALIQQALEYHPPDPESRIWEETDEHIRFRVRDPDLFVRLRIIWLSEDEGIKAIIGPLKTDPDGPTVIQAILWMKEKGWTMEKAKKWWADHKDEIASGLQDEERIVAIEAQESSVEPALDPTLLRNLLRDILDAKMRQHFGL